MTDPHSRVGVGRPETGFWWVRGRAGRREYWAYVGALMIISYLMREVPPALSLVGATLLALAQTRRLHDFDRSGWWALAALLAPVAIGLIVFFATGSELSAVVVSSVVTLGALIWIGAVAGTPGDNRFGPQPPFSARRVLTGRDA
jgi:uncharacterized membrane protein YhaH (DUF805 family)